MKQEIRFQAGAAYCGEWSGTGNPGSYSGELISAGTTAYWGLEFAKAPRHAFNVNFTLPGNGRSILRHPPLYVELDLNDALKNEVSEISTLPADRGSELTSDTNVVGDDRAGSIRIVTAAVRNPGDGTWTGGCRSGHDWFPDQPAERQVIRRYVGPADDLTAGRRGSRRWFGVQTCDRFEACSTHGLAAPTIDREMLAPRSRQSAKSVRPVRSRRSRLSGCLVLAAVLLGATAGLTACGSEESRTVPVLWAATQNDGTVAGGIEPAKVSVESLGSTGFSLILEDIAAKGAGEQWQAASSSAAAVGTLLSGADPNDVDVSFEVTGPIDGPSGGAALTVGVLAAVRGDELRSGVTMTGTINPDGSIGPVTNVATKVRAAAKDDYETVLIPFGTEIEIDPATGREIRIEELGRSLGVDVRVAPDIGTAYRAFTGNDIATHPDSPAVVGRSVTEVAERTTSQLKRRIRAALEESGPGVVGREASRLARGALAAGREEDIALEYALGVDALKQVERDRLAGEVGRAFDRRGASSARDLLDGRIRAVELRAARVKTRALKRARASYEQQLLVPMALGWITYSTAMLEVVGERLRKGTGGPAELEELSGVVADAETSIDVLGPDAIEAALASRSGDAPPRSEEEVSAFLSGYTNFLIRGGKASETYFEDVVRSIGPGQVPGYIYPAFRSLGKTVDQIPEGTNPLDREMLQASEAITYFVLGTILVSGDSILGLKSFGVGDDIALRSGSELLPNSTEAALNTVDDLSALLQERGLSAGYPVWSSRWGRAGFEAFSGTDREASGAVLALEEAWYSAIGCFMLGGLTG